MDWEKIKDKHIECAMGKYDGDDYYWAEVLSVAQTAYDLGRANGITEAAMLEGGARSNPDPYHVHRQNLVDAARVLWERLKINWPNGFDGGVV